MNWGACGGGSLHWRRLGVQDGNVTESEEGVIFDLISIESDEDLYPFCTSISLHDLFGREQ